MSEHRNIKELKSPEGDFADWDKDTSNTNGLKYYTRTLDTNGKTLKKDPSADQPNSHGPPFANESCYWTAETSGPTSADFANKTGITWYKLEKTVGWTYQLTINTNQTYDYTFKTPAGSYDLDVYLTSHTHEVTYTTFEPTVTSVSGK